MCAWVDFFFPTSGIFLSHQLPETGNKEEKVCRYEGEREDDKTKSSRADLYACYIPSKDNLHFEFVLC